MIVAPGSLGFELLPAPEPDEVMTAFLKELEITIVVERLRCFGAVRARPHAIVEIVQDMGAGQVNRFPVSALAGCDCEVAWIGFGDYQRPRSDMRLLLRLGGDVLCPDIFTHLIPP